MNLSSNSLTVLKNRYLLKNKEGNIIETPQELFDRVSAHIARAEIFYRNKDQQNYWREKFYSLLSSLEFLPNSPTLMNSGLVDGQLSACFVLPIKNSEKSIKKTLSEALKIQKSGGGTGFNFSNLYYSTTDQDLDNLRNPVGYIHEFNDAMNTIKIVGKRNGANMGILNVDHPDIEEFISSKLSESKLGNFNISVGITDKFMYALMADNDWPLTHPENGSVIKKVKAVQIWKAIINAAWQSGDPGLVFLDTIERYNPTPKIGKLSSTNPCGEVPLIDYEACNLGSINLSLMVKNKGRHKSIDWEKLKRIIPVCIRFLDNVIDINYYLVKEIEEIVKGNRKIGLGVMGWAEMLVNLGLRYDSEEAVMLGKKVMRFIKDESLKTSAALAKEKGTFPNWIKSKYFPDIPLRNATVNSIAPTGTISIIANTSSSIEPFFALSYNRKNILDGTDVYERNSLLQKYFLKYGLNQSEFEEKVTQSGIISNEETIPGIFKDLFKTSLQIPYEYHLKHQVAFQRYTDNAVSKTINLPSYATKEDVDLIYKEAWRKGLKGITIYRYGSKIKQVLYQGAESKENVTVQSQGCKICIG